MSVVACIQFNPPVEYTKVKEGKKKKNKKFDSLISVRRSMDVTLFCTSSHCLFVFCFKENFVLILYLYIYSLSFALCIILI